MGAVSPNFDALDLVGSATPRLWTRPLRKLTPRTSLGFEVVDFSRDVLGVPLLPWQEWLFIHGLELKPDGSYRFRTVLVLVARQNGKTTALMVLALWRMVMDAARMILGTSTNLDYARESWQKATELAWGPKGSKVFQGVPELEGEFLLPRYANGEQELTHAEGGRYKIGTASRTGGRSLSVDLLILDELREHRTWEAWSAASKTTNARPRGQRWALSNMGDDGSVVLNHLQAKAIEDSDPSLAIFEWSAPPGCDVADRSVWPLANPALGHTISVDTLASDLSTDAEKVFRTEVLCQRVPTLEPPPIDPNAWDALATTASVSGPPAFFLDCSPDLYSAAIAGATMHNGRPYVMLADHQSGTDWVPARVAELVEKYPAARWQYERTGPASALVEQLKTAGVAVEKPFNGTDLARGCVHLQRLVGDGGLAHSDDEAVAEALVAAVKREVGDPGLWSWGRRRSAGDISPLVAVTGALWLLETLTPAEPAFAFSS